MVVEKGVHREQLDRSNAEVIEVGDHRRCSEPGVGAAQVRGQVWMTGREPLDVEFVDHRIVERGVGAAVVAPGKGTVDDDPLGDAPGVGVVVPHQVIPTPHRIAEDRSVPVDSACERTCVWIDEELGPVEAMSGLRIPGAIDPIAIALAGTDTREIAMPDVGANLSQGHTLLVLPGVVEQAQLDLCRVLAEQREVRSNAVPRRAEREPRSRADAQSRRHATHAIASVIVHWCDYTVPRAPDEHISCQESGDSIHEYGVPFVMAWSMQSSIRFWTHSPPRRKYLGGYVQQV